MRELSKFSTPDTNTPASLRAIVNTFKNHPALGLWKNFDESWWGGVSEADLQRGYEVIRQEDINHPVVQTHAPRGTVADLQPYNAAADILALDIYPVGVPPGAHSLLPNKEISMVGDWAQFLDQVGNQQKKFWMIEQIAWSGVIPPGKTLVFPTFGQSRYMAYQAIINGARGLMFFGGNIAATLNAQDAPLGWNWTFWNNVLKRIVRELGDNSVLAPALVATHSQLPITIGGTTWPDLEFSVREVPPYLYILSSKREGSITNVTFQGLPSWATNGEVLYEPGRVVNATNGQFSDSFAPFDVHVYRFSQTNQPPTILSQPKSRTNYSGTTAIFSITTDGTGPLSYQWIKNGTNLLDGGHVFGSRTSTLTLTAITSADAGNYNVMVSNEVGSTNSASGLLTVVYPFPYYEPFDYPAGSNLGGQMNGSFLTWSDIGTSTPGSFVTIQTNSLSVAGLRTSVGNSISFGSLGKSARFSFPAESPLISGTLYYSFALQIVDTNGLTSSGTFIAGFNNSIGPQTTQPTVVGTRLYIRATNSGFNLGLSKNSST
ncbi:MAG: immunoglobulin domain-containing protein, partial [Limisphaerales bacterium]